MTKKFDDETEIHTLGIDVPRWIDSDITVSQVAAIVQGGCASGAYMPAVTYYEALKTMGEHGDDVLEFIEESFGEMPTPGKDAQSWSGMACFYLSVAVELWASNVESQLEDLPDDDDDDDETENDVEAATLPPAGSV